MSCQSPLCWLLADVKLRPLVANRGGLSPPPEGLGLVGDPMRCPWYLFHRLF
ncbi:unnamed protein product [Staurois parvus]|uniref:Uncharacterized protein n=1 Tax=Staurois parvus TaxID=386267 RepID=A0ABN9E4F7_9NEOB|nr:unnamed protein product [Staurois parvus]